MKTLVLIFFFFIAKSSLAQKPQDIISIRFGYSSTNIVFKEAFEPSVQFFGVNFNTGKTFVGDGPELGISKSISNKLFIDISFSTFSGQDIKLKANNNEHYYTLEGFHIPLTANYLLRDSSKRFRVKLGAGLQYLNGHLEQFEKITTTGGQITNEVTDIHISELQIVLRPGIQFRIIPNLFAMFVVKVGISTNGRYADYPCLSLKYTFVKKK